MGRPKRKRVKPSVPVYDSDDERAYRNEKIPDKNDDSYFYDDIDEFHATRDKILLEKGAGLQQAEDTSDEEEIMPIESDDDDDDDMTEYDRQLAKFRVREMDDEMASDLDERKGDDDLPDDRAWGKTKHKFYGADVDDDDDDFSGSEPGDAELEEEEVRAIQKRMAEQLDDQDFGLDIFKPPEVASSSSEVREKEKIKKDLTKLSKKEKLQLLKKESPELLDLIADYKQQMKELKNRLLPVQQLIRDGTLPKGKAAQYVETKVQLILTYTVNITFYLMLKAKQTPVHNHPVIGRLVQFRNLLKQLEPVDALLKDEMDAILEKIQSGEAIVTTQKVSKKKDTRKKVTKKKKRKLSELLTDEEESSGEDVKSKQKKTKKSEGKFETKDEREALEYYAMMKSGRRKEEDEMSDGGELDDDEGEPHDEDNMAEGGEGDEMGKRAINYQMEKNKGLTPHRKKELRNPRVKHRMKYRKAKIRRRGQVREVRTEMSRYGGELSGIRAGIKRSIKLK